MGEDMNYYYPWPREVLAELQPILTAWSLTPLLHRWYEPATDEEIEEAQGMLQRPIPASLKALYQMSSGAELLLGNLKIYPLTPTDDSSLSLVTGSSQLREWEWLIPDELVIFGNNGSDDLFGLWMPQGIAGKAQIPVIMVGEIFTPRCMAVVGTSLASFLKAWSAFYIQNDPDDIGDALDALGVPSELRNWEPDMSALFAWADPSLPDTNPDPYERGLTADELRQMYGRTRA